MDAEALRAQLLTVIAGLQSIADGLELPAPPEEPEEPQEPPQEPEEPAPPPVIEPGVGIAAVADLKPGEWMQFGRPWSDLEAAGHLDRQRDNGGIDLARALGAWCGGLWDGDRFWSWAPGGHSDGLINALLSYDLAAGRPEVVAPHMPLNVPLQRAYKLLDGVPLDGWLEPYVSATPWPAGMDVSKEEALADGPVVNYDNMARDADGNWIVPMEEAFGAMIRPRSSHFYNNMVKVGEWIVLAPGQIYGSGKPIDDAIFGFNTVTGEIRRLPPRRENGRMVGGYNVNWLAIPGRGLFMFSGAGVTEADPLAGRYVTTRHKSAEWSNGATLAWDAERQGVWAVDSTRARITFSQEIEGEWLHVLVKTDPRLADKELGEAGICVVPTPNGTNVLVKGKGAGMFRWNGEEGNDLIWMDAPVGPAHILNKFTYRADLGVCLLIQGWNEGVWAYRPDFASAPPEEEEPEPEEPDEPQEPAPPVDLGVTFHTFAGHLAAPKPREVAPWDWPIERQPEAPDYSALTPGSWELIHCHNDADVAAANVRIRSLMKAGTPNARVYLHPMIDAGGQLVAYSEKLALDSVQGGEVVGIPKDGKRPVTKAQVELAKTAVGGIFRGFDFDGANLNWGAHGATRSAPKFIVLQDMRINGGAGIMGVSDPTFPLTYLEFSGVVCGPNPDWHGLYLERSIGDLVVKSSAFFASNSDKHAFKCLAHRSRIEGSVFSNVGLDGQPVAHHKNGAPVVGMMPLDLYAPCESVFAGNTVIFRTSGNARQCMAYRDRNAWEGNNKGLRIGDGPEREVWSPSSEAFFDPAKWQEIAEAAQDFDHGYMAALRNPWLFTHLNEGNTFVVFEAFERGGVPLDDTRIFSVGSTRPVAGNAREKANKAEYEALVALCAGDADCWYENASEGARYVYDHIDPNLRGELVQRGRPPNNQPIRTPDGWLERAGVYVGDNNFITCSADGSVQAVTGARAFDANPLPWDAVQVARPPRVIRI